MQAVILLGGKGTRLSALYPDRPKALVPVAGRPFIEWQLDWLARGGIDAVHLAAGHMADRLEAWLHQRDPSPFVSGLPSSVFRFPSSLTLSREPEPRGTGGGLKYIEPHIASDPFLVLNGDSLLPNLDFRALLHQHTHFPTLGKLAPPDFQCLEKRPAATLAVVRMTEAGRYGTVEFDDWHFIGAFREKAERKAGWVNGGVYAMDREVLASIPPDTNISIEHDTFPALVAARRLRAFPCAPPLHDMGTPEGLEAMERLLNEPRSTS